MLIDFRGGGGGGLIAIIVIPDEDLFQSTSILTQKHIQCVHLLIFSSSLKN